MSDCSLWNRAGPSKVGRCPGPATSSRQTLVCRYCIVHCTAQLPGVQQREGMLMSVLQVELEAAVRAGNCPAARALLSRPGSVDINRLSKEGVTPVQAAALAGSLPLVRLLLGAGADPNLRSRDGWSTLHMAAYSGHPEITQHLLCSRR